MAGSPLVFGLEPVGLVGVVDTATGRFTKPPVELDPWAMATVVWTPDSDMLIAGGQMGDLIFLDPDSLEELDRVPLTANTAITDITIDRAGAIAHASNEQGEVWSIDITSRTVLGPPLVGSTAQFQSVSFSSDGRLAAATGRDGNIRIWNTETGRIIGAQLKGAEASFVRFIDDDTLVSWGWGPTYRWELGLDELQATACRLAGRPLNADELATFNEDLPRGDVCG